LTDTMFNGRERSRTTTSDRRHGVFDHRPEPSVPLADDHPAIVGSTTRYPKSVIRTKTRSMILKDGKHQRKLGDRIKVGAWAGAKVFAVTLIERETCPSYCEMWRTCYGNNMHWSHRHDPARPGSLDDLELEVNLACWTHEKVAIRLHVLGDFPTMEYAELWHRALRTHDNLHLFGFTALRVGGSRHGDAIAHEIAIMNRHYPDRCRIRWSGTWAGGGGDYGGGGAMVRDIADPENTPGAFPCSAQTGKADGCDTCGMCWAEKHWRSTVVFQDHGRPKSGRKSEMAP